MTEPSDECVERVAMLRARKIVEDHIASYGMVPHPDRIKESIAAALAKAALAALAPAARDGWVLVPREPTEEMLVAAVPEPTHLYLTVRGAEYEKQMKIAVQVDRLATADKYRAMLAVLWRAQPSAGGGS